jgi:hypothetical protein
MEPAAQNADWSGTITQLRIDPATPKSGTEVMADFYIDSIEFLKELPQ